MGYLAGLQCDNDDCKQHVIFMGDMSKELINQWARKEGWKIGKHITCPECARKAKGKNE